MRKGLTKFGNSYGVIIDKPILELLKITADTPIEVSTDGERLVLTPIRAEEPTPAYGDREALRAAAAEVVEIYAETFRKLAK
jgi:antitoxin component of MazEF toxin-antitoxin module